VNKFGILDETTSTTLLIAKQPNFIGELALLQNYATQLGATAHQIQLVSTPNSTHQLHTRTSKLLA
jgi:hypothetical protein